MLPVQPRCRSQGDEKLAAIGVGSAIRHAQDPCARMFQCRADFILELFAVDRAAPSACAGGVAALDHEIGDDAVEDHVVVVAALCEGCKVLAGLYIPME